MQLERPQTLEEACALLAEHDADAKVVAGGTAVVLMLQHGLIAPKVLISLQDLDRNSGLRWRGIDVSATRIRLGAGTTLTDIARSPVVRSQLPSLATAAAKVGNARIRNVATIGGNLAEADYASDPPSALISLEATCTVVGPHRQRTLPVRELITDFYTTSLATGELISEVSIPLPHRSQHAVYLKFQTRSSEDRPCVGIAARALVRRGRLKDVRLVVGAVASTPQQSPDAAAIIEGKRPTPDRIAEVARELAASVDPMSDQRGSAAYRKRMIEVHARRALTAIARGEGKVQR